MPNKPKRTEQMKLGTRHLRAESFTARSEIVKTKKNLWDGQTMKVSQEDSVNIIIMSAKTGQVYAKTD